MLLAVDVGNTHTVFGLFAGEQLQRHWRVQTNRGRTADEYGVLLDALLAAAGKPEIEGVAVSSVVPPVTQTIAALSQLYLGLEPLVVGPGTPTGLRLLYDDPRQVGSDRVVNAVAAWQRTRADTIVVDCGTATKFEFISADGAYHGGAIAPGLGIAADALFERAARLYRVELVKPPTILGRNTPHALQSGLIHGYVGMIDGMVDRIRDETGTEARVLATGGWAPLLAPNTRSLREVDEFLTLDGLRLIFHRHTKARKARRARS